MEAAAECLMFEAESHEGSDVADAGAYKTGEEQSPAADAYEHNAGEEQPAVADAQVHAAGEEKPPEMVTQEHTAGEEQPPEVDAQQNDACAATPCIDEEPSTLSMPEKRTACAPEVPAANDISPTLGEVESGNAAEMNAFPLITLSRHSEGVADCRITTVNDGVMDLMNYLSPKSNNKILQIHDLRDTPIRLVGILGSRREQIIDFLKGVTDEVPLNDDTAMGLYALPVKEILYIVFWPHHPGTLDDDFSLSIRRRLSTNFTHFLFDLTPRVTWLFTDNETQAVMTLQQKNAGPRGADGLPSASPQTQRPTKRQTELRITRSAGRRTECLLHPGFSASLADDNGTLYAYSAGTLVTQNRVEYTNKTNEEMPQVTIADFWAQRKFRTTIKDTIPLELYLALARECPHITDTTLVTQFQEELTALESKTSAPQSNGDAGSKAFVEAKTKDVVKAALDVERGGLGATGEESVFLSKVINEASTSGKQLWVSARETDICIVEEGNARFTLFDWCSGHATSFSNAGVNVHNWDYVADHPTLSHKKLFIARCKATKNACKKAARGPLLTSGWSGVPAKTTDWRIGTLADLTYRWTRRPHEILKHVKDTTELIRRVMNKKTIQEQKRADCLKSDEAQYLDLVKRARAAIDPLLLLLCCTNSSVMMNVKKMERVSDYFFLKLMRSPRYRIAISIDGGSQFANQIRVFDIRMKKSSDAEEDPKHAILSAISSTIELPLTHCVTKILFLVDLQQGCKQLVVQENDEGHAVVMVGQNVLTTIKQWPIGMVTFNRKQRALAMSSKNAESVSVMVFDPEFRNSFHLVPPFSLHCYEQQPLRRMHFLPSSKELCLVFDNTARFYDLSKKRMHTRKYELPPHHDTLTNQLGTALFVVHNETAQQQNQWTLRVIKCADGSTIADLPLSKKMYTPKAAQHDENQMSELHILVVGGKEFLARVDKSAVYAERIELNFEEQRSKLNVVGNGTSSLRKTRDAATDERTTPFDVIYDIYSKYAIIPTVKQHECKDTDLSRRILVISDSRSVDSTTFRDALQQETKAVLQRLKDDTCKPDVDVLTFDIKCPSASSGTLQTIEHASDTTADAFLYNVAALVPVQIARAQNEGITILKNGARQELDGSVSVQDVASRISFGLYDLLLDEKEKPVVVISSMGKQSTGKSSMLNQLVGTCFDVSGARCTDGVWMSVRECEKFIIVVFDFEGVGSLERSAQEDMLLSVFNAAVSNATYFRTESRLDADVANIFSRMQQGAKLLSGGQDKESFTGVFHIVIKDVVSDVEEVKEEFINKIQTLCDKDKDNFFSTLYNGKINLIAFPCPKHADFYTEFNTLCNYIYDIYDDTARRYENAFVFKQNCKLLLAKFAMKDWTPTDQNRCRMILDSLRKNLPMAITAGCSSVKSDGYEPLINWRTNKPHGGTEPPSDVLPPDVGLVLGEIGDDATEDSFQIHVSEPLIRTLASRFLLASSDPDNDRTDSVKRGPPTTDQQFDISADWKVTFEDSLQKCAARRAKRIEDWMHANCANFTDNGDVVRLKSETTRHLKTLSTRLRLCNHKCVECDMPCLLPIGHDGSNKHNCLTDHRCLASCAHCSGVRNKCTLARNHDGAHDCGDEAHMCGKTCALSSFTNCMNRCSLRPDHADQEDHKCAAARHLCGELCSLPTCMQRCIKAHDERHERHECDVRRCPKQCSFPKCTFPCANADHFHAADERARSSCWCVNNHQCVHDCEEEGVCEVFSKLRVTKKEFKGALGTFSYDELSAQNGIRKKCCKTVLAGQMEHEGKHMHDEGHNTVHYCEEKCPMCGYYCTKQAGHAGLHATTHGNMRHTTFVSQEDKCTLGSRVYMPGESGKAEMCNMFCHAKGRGHIHVKLCKDVVSGADAHLCSMSMYPEDRRHSTKRYKPDVDTPKDELMHAAFWEDLGFEDPCSEEDQKLFGLCPHMCPHESHQQAGARPSFCTGRLWHPQMTNISSGSVSSDGHHFTCAHSLVVHTIFCVDISPSMEICDCIPQKLPWKHYYPNRFGCALEAVQAYAQHREQQSPQDTASLILFGGTAKCAVQKTTINSFASILETMTDLACISLTSFSAPLLEAKRIADDVCSPDVPIVVVFLSDGEACKPTSELQELCEIRQQLRLHTIFFSSAGDRRGVLQSMVFAVKYIRPTDVFSSKSTFMHKLDAASLEESFVGIADSLVPEGVQGELVVNA
eukprot:GEMP01000533.1.p1 GENE.GEMP01000533.1~~GEMP01000533.1.p1  ORF type:complete len:2197 (-),score=481.84 GEMP01000533.1:22-6612(-)